MGILGQDTDAAIGIKAVDDARSGAHAAAHPVMLMLSQAWRFNIAIPDGAKMVSPVAMDAGDGSREDFADWTNAGFIVKP